MVPTRSFVTRRKVWDLTASEGERGRVGLVFRSDGPLDRRDWGRGTKGRNRSVYGSRSVLVTFLPDTPTRVYLTLVTEPNPERSYKKSV